MFHLVSHLFTHIHTHFSSPVKSFRIYIYILKYIYIYKTFIPERKGLICKHDCLLESCDVHMDLQQLNDTQFVSKVRKMYIGSLHRTQCIFVSS